MPPLKPCPFCGSQDLRSYKIWLECVTCKATYIVGKNELEATEVWNLRIHIPAPPEIICEFPNCGKPAVYEGWYRRRDPFLGTPSGHIVRISFCESCKSHPHLCANESREEAAKKREQGTTS